MRRQHAERTETCDVCNAVDGQQGSQPACCSGCGCLRPPRSPSPGSTSTPAREGPKLPPGEKKPRPRLGHFTIWSTDPAPLETCPHPGQWAGNCSHLRRGPRSWTGGQVSPLPGRRCSCPLPGRDFGRARFLGESGRTLFPGEVGPDLPIRIGRSDPPAGRPSSWAAFSRVLSSAGCSRALVLGEWWAGFADPTHRSPPGSPGER